MRPEIVISYGSMIWKKRTAEKLTDSLFAINYIIPRKDDVIVIAVARKERRCVPYRYDKNSHVLSELELGIDFNCSLCTYHAASGRLVLSGTSYKQELDIREAWNSRKNQDDPYLSSRHLTFMNYRRAAHSYNKARSIFG